MKFIDKTEEKKDIIVAELWGGDFFVLKGNKKNVFLFLGIEDNMYMGFNFTTNRVDSFRGDEIIIPLKDVEISYKRKE